VPRRRLRSRLIRTTRQRRTTASVATLAATTALALTLVIAVSAGIAIYVTAYLGGVVLGVGTIGMAWLFSSSWQAPAKRGRSLGRSRTQDCRQARWTRPVHSVVPHPPTEAQRRVRPCPGSRRL
jgi:hypothetical protein